MDFFKKYTTPSGYVIDGNQADEYGIDHSGFSTRDEPEYQFARQERENQLADILNNKTTRSRAPDSGKTIPKMTSASATTISQPISRTSKINI